MSSIKNGKLFYHLTDVDNLESIFQNGLLSRSNLNEFSDVADSEIIDSRRQLQLEQYVPFHFYAGSPFDGRVQLDNRDKSFVLITVRRDHAQAQGWKVIPKHPLANGSIEIMDYGPGLAAINWELMDQRDYHDDDCRSVCMAECLSPTSVPANRFFSIFVQNSTELDLVSKFVRANRLDCHVNINPNMFVSRD